MPTDPLASDLGLPGDPSPTAQTGQATQLAPGAIADLSPEVAASLDATLGHLRQLHHSAVLRHALQVGRYLLDSFYAGDIAQFHDGSPAAHASFEALLTHRKEALADLGLSPSTLRNYIRAWDVWADLPEATRERLALHHLGACRTKVRRAPSPFFLLWRKNRLK